MLAISIICLNNVCVPPFYRLLPEIIYCGTPWENVLQRLCLEIFEFQNASAYSVICSRRFYFLYRLKRRWLCPSTLFLLFHLFLPDLCWKVFGPLCFNFQGGKLQTCRFCCFKRSSPMNLSNLGMAFLWANGFSISSDRGLSVDCWVTCWRTNAFWLVEYQSMITGGCVVCWAAAPSLSSLVCYDILYFHLRWIYASGVLVLLLYLLVHWNRTLFAMTSLMPLRWNHRIAFLSIFHKRIAFEWGMLLAAYSTTHFICK